MSPYIVIATIAAYLALLFTVAWVTGRRTDNQGFFVGNRRSPWYVVAIGMIAAPMSGVTFVSVPGMVASNGFAYLQMALGFVVGYCVIAFVLIPLLYRRRIVSVYEYLADRFGLSSYRTGAWFFFVSKMLGASVKIFLVCLVLQLLVFEPLGVPFAANVAVMMLLVWLYTFRGGVKSIVWTDALKTFCLLLSVGLSIWFIARALGMAPGRMAAAIKESEMSRVFFFDDIDDRRYFFKQFLAGLFTVVAMTGLDQDMMQLPLSCRSPRDAQKNFVVSGAMQFIVIGLFLCLGVLLNIYVAAEGLAAPASGDELFPFVATRTGLPGIVGVVFALGLISSTYSAAGSALTALTTSFTVDILGRGRNTGGGSGNADCKEPNAESCGSDNTDRGRNTECNISYNAEGGGSGSAVGSRRKDEARLTRTRTIVHICIAIGMALVVMAFRATHNVDSVIDAVYVLSSYTYGPILGMYAFGMTVRRSVRDRWVPLVAVLSPLLCLVLDLNSEAWFGGYRFGYELLIMNAMFTFAGLAMLIKRRA